MRLDALGGGDFAPAERTRGRQSQFRLRLLEQGQPLRDHRLLRCERVHLRVPLPMAGEQRRALGAHAFEPAEVLKTRRSGGPCVAPGCRHGMEPFDQRAMALGQRRHGRDCLRFLQLGEIERGDPVRLDRLSIGEIVGGARARLFSSTSASRAASGRAATAAPSALR